MSKPVITFATSLKDYKELSIRATALSNESKSISALFMTEKAMNWRNYDQVLAQISEPSSRAKIKPDFEKKHAEWLKNHRKATEEKRWSYLRALQEILQQSRQIVELWKSPAQVATLDGIGSEERSRYQDQCKGLGPASLASLSLKSELENNRALASTLIAINDALPTDKRFMSSHELAAKIWKADVDAAKECHKQIDMAFSNALAENRKCEGFRPSVVDAVSHAIKYKDVSAPSVPSNYDLGLDDEAA